MGKPLPSPKSRLRPVYTVPPNEAPRTEAVIYQLEDVGHPSLRLRPTVREVYEDGQARYIYRVAAFSRLSGVLLGAAERQAPPGSDEEFAAASRAFQTDPFRRVLGALSAELGDRYAATEEAAPEPA